MELAHPRAAPLRLTITIAIAIAITIITITITINYLLLLLLLLLGSLPQKPLMHILEGAVDHKAGSRAHGQSMHCFTLLVKTVSERAAHSAITAGGIDEVAWIYSVAARTHEPPACPRVPHTTSTGTRLSRSTKSTWTRRRQGTSRLKRWGDKTCFFCSTGLPGLRSIGTRPISARLIATRMT